MSRFKVKSSLMHDKYQYNPGDEIELHKDEYAAKHLVELGVIEYLPPAQASAEAPSPKKVEAFHAPTSEAEITKAVAKQKLGPNPKANCNKCKKVQVITDYELVKTKAGKVAIKGRCPVCGGGVWGLYGGITK